MGCERGLSRARDPGQPASHHPVSAARVSCTRFHLHLDCRGLALCCCRHRPVLAPRRGRVDEGRDGELLLVAQNRADRPPNIPHSQSGQSRRVRSHRTLLQSGTQTLAVGVSQPGGLRKESWCHASSPFFREFPAFSLIPANSPARRVRSGLRDAPIEDRRPTGDPPLFFHCE